MRLLCRLICRYRNVLECPTHAVIPYEQGLHRLPAYLQQLEMESNGKSTQLNGQPCAWPTCPVVWGEPGTNGQHAFFQLLHQGSGPLTPLDLLIGKRECAGDARAHRTLLANCLAQAEALLQGKNLAQVSKESNAQFPLFLL